jgi:protein-S-isoprenylcysteine O-methyltransferase Ste14
LRATRVEFRFRVITISALYFLGFFAPWERFAPNAPANLPRLWSWLALELARTNLLSVGNAYLAITALAVALAIAGAILRVWGTAYLGHGVMRNAAMQAGTVMASGPYRHLRNPLYLGMLLASAAISILMPTTGALLFLVGILVFTLRLIGGEEAFLSAQLGDAYLDYRKAVPSILPSLRPRLAAATVKPRWGQALLAELFWIGTAACFSVVAWSYEADLLSRCVLVCFGAALVVHALIGSRSSGQTENAL